MLTGPAPALAGNKGPFLQERLAAMDFERLLHKLRLRHVRSFDVITLFEGVDPLISMEMEVGESTLRSHTGATLRNALLASGRVRYSRQMRFYKPKDDAAESASPVVLLGRAQDVGEEHGSTNAEVIVLHDSKNDGTVMEKFPEHKLASKIPYLGESFGLCLSSQGTVLLMVRKGAQPLDAKQYVNIWETAAKACQKRSRVKLEDCMLDMASNQWRYNEYLRTRGATRKRKHASISEAGGDVQAPNAGAAHADEMEGEAAKEAEIAEKAHLARWLPSPTYELPATLDFHVLKSSSPLEKVHAKVFRSHSAQTGLD